jgi:hypothetical protein
MGDKRKTIHPQKEFLFITFQKKKWIKLLFHAAIEANEIFRPAILKINLLSRSSLLKTKSLRRMYRVYYSYRKRVGSFKKFWPNRGNQHFYWTPYHQPSLNELVGNRISWNINNKIWFLPPLEIPTFLIRWWMRAQCPTESVGINDGSTDEHARILLLVHNLMQMR